MNEAVKDDVAIVSVVIYFLNALKTVNDVYLSMVKSNHCE